MDNRAASRAQRYVPGVWQDDPRRQALAEYFRATPGMGVPNNPKVFESFHMTPNALAPGVSADRLVLSNVYDDGFVEAQLPTPELVAQVPAAAGIMAPDLAPGADLQVRTPGYGFDPTLNPLTRVDAAQQVMAPAAPGQAAMPPQQLGMSTSVNAAGSGPQRNVPAPKAA